MKLSAEMLLKSNKSHGIFGELSEKFAEFSRIDAGYPVAHLLQSLLNSARLRLNMEVAFISEFTDGRRVFRYVSTKPGLTIIKVGEGGPLSESYCQRVVDGRLPELIRDAQILPEALTLDATKGVPVGAHMSVPIKFSDGTVYGTFCAFSRVEDNNLDTRDLAFLKVLADITTIYLEHQLHHNSSEQRQRTLLQEIIEKPYLKTLFQPIVRLSDGNAAGFEALTSTTKHRISPDKLFALAINLGMNEELSKVAINSAMRLARNLPEECYVSINAGPHEILNGLIEKIFKNESHLSRFVIEITEHTIVNDYQEMVTALNRLRRMGLRIAVDDAGAGYASFRHILMLKPDIIKIDISLVRNIHLDIDKQDLVAVLREFCLRKHANMVAEGVETREELVQLQKLGVEYVQGFLISRPCEARELIDSKNFFQNNIPNSISDTQP